MNICTLKNALDQIFEFLNISEVECKLSVLCETGPRPTFPKNHKLEGPSKRASDVGTTLKCS